MATPLIALGATLGLRRAIRCIEISAGAEGRRGGAGQRQLSSWPCPARTEPALSSSAAHPEGFHNAKLGNVLQGLNSPPPPTVNASV